MKYIGILFVLFLSVSIVSADPLCGNGVIEAGEDCDDGNTDDGDYCPSTCMVDVTHSGSISDTEQDPEPIKHVFWCNAHGFDPEYYFWTFGDGEQQIGQYAQAHHLYTASNEYQVTCVATDGVSYAKTSINVDATFELEDSYIDVGRINGDLIGKIYSSTPEKKRTFDLPVRYLSLAGFSFRAAGSTNDASAMDVSVYREQGTGGLLRYWAFCDEYSYLSPVLIGGIDTNRRNPARVHVLREHILHYPVDVIVNFKLAEKYLEEDISALDSYQGIARSFIDIQWDDRTRKSLQHYFKDGSEFEINRFLKMVESIRSQGFTQVTLKSERSLVTKDTAMTTYTFKFRNIASPNREHIITITSAPETVYVGARYDISVLRAAGMQIPEYSPLDTHWRSGTCGTIGPQ